MCRRVRLCCGPLEMLGGADLIQRFIHLGDDVEAVEDMQRLGTFLANHIQVGLPHIRADELDLRSELLSDDGEETLEGFDGAFLADPEQAGDPLVDLVDQGITRLLWVGKERTIESFQGFFTVIGEQLASQIEFVCSDMWQPYLDVIRQKCSQALHILDRFHIVAKMNKALDEVRAAESRKMAQEGHEPLLKKSRWCVLKRKENLTSQQKFRLRDLLRYNLQTVRAYLLKEDFQQFWEYNSPTWAGMFLDFWCYQTMRSRIEPMKKIARTLRAHRSLLLNYFKAKKQFSSGVVEGLNNKAKVTMRRSYGFRTFRILELALYHSLGKLPEPELTHDFF